MAGKARGRKSIFITGAASGMGRETAKLFHSKGWFVGGYDVNDKADFDAAVKAFGEETDGKMDILFSNAGIGESGWFEDIPFEAALRVIQVNFIGVVASLYAALPLLKATPKSLCFITSSSSATYGMPRIAVYAATKFAVKGLTEALSVEFARHGVRVADVLPGLIDTNILRATPNRSGDAPKPTEDEFYARAPKKGMFRLTPPSEIAECVWKAYGSNRLHWYGPAEIGRIDLIKALAPRFTRNIMAKNVKRLAGQEE